MATRDDYALLYGLVLVRHGDCVDLLDPSSSDVHALLRLSREGDGWLLHAFYGGLELSAEEVVTLVLDTVANRALTTPRIQVTSNRGKVEALLCTVDAAAGCE